MVIFVTIGYIVIHVPYIYISSETQMKLTEEIHLLKIDFEVTLSPEKKLARFVNVILIFGDKITLFDTGVKGSEEKLFAYLDQNKRKFVRPNIHKWTDINKMWGVKEI